MRSIVYTANPSRVIFGAGTVGQVRSELERLGAHRVLLLSGPRLAELTERIRADLGARAVAAFDQPAAHTPTEVTERALAVAQEHAVDGVVAVGGGSTTGLAKALAVRTGVPQVIVPTTYAGSELTPVLGETSGGEKVIRSGPEILPETVIYDVELTLRLPTPVTVTSAINALAHAVEALYAPERNPVVDLLALEATRLIATALPVVVADPADSEARAELLRAAWLAGTCLGTVSMGLHHKLCHTLGGTFSLPHAATHTVVLPQAMAYNAAAVPAVMARIAEAVGAPDAPTGVYDLVTAVGGPTSLRELGMAEVDLDHAVELAIARPYPNPRELARAPIARLLDDSWAGRRPSSVITHA
jgi:alcohol dehydrogenase class IV